MAPPVIDLRTAEDVRDVVHRAVQALAEEKIVAVPTETVYGIGVNALSEAAVRRLAEVKGRASDQPFTLAVNSADAALDYAPDMSPVARRLARRCWPGPLTMVLDDQHPDSLTRRLPPSVRQAVTKNGKVGLRVPAHDLTLSILRLSPGPLALTSANRSGEADAATAESVVQSLGAQVDLVLDDGQSKFRQPSSVVRVDGHRLTLLRSGVIGKRALHQLASYIVLFVCTGNTCRSPMAERLMRRRVADRLGCSVEQLEERGVMILSAGIAAMTGGQASQEAVAVMNEQGVDLSDHESQPLTERLVRFADLILTMTKGHRDAIITQWPEAAERTFLVARDQADITDPIGGTAQLYHQCAAQIDAHLEHWVKAIDFSTVLAEIADDGD